MRSVGTRLLLGRLAVMGPIAFTIAWIVGAVVQDEYSLRREDISALAALDAQNAWIMVTGFLLLGVGIVALGAGLAGALNGRPATVGSILVAVAGVGIIVAGLARNDCSSQLAGVRRPRRRRRSVLASRHPRPGQPRGVPRPCGRSTGVRPCLPRRPVVARPAYLLPHHRGTGSRVAGSVHHRRVAGSWNGLLQRVFVTVLFLWIAVLGARLIRLSRTQSAEPAT